MVTVVCDCLTVSGLWLPAIWLQIVTWFSFFHHMETWRRGASVLGLLFSSNKFSLSAWALTCIDTCLYPTKFKQRAQLTFCNGVPAGDVFWMERLVNTGENRAVWQTTTCTKAGRSAWAGRCLADCGTCLPWCRHEGMRSTRGVEGSDSAGKWDFDQWSGRNGTKWNKLLAHTNTSRSTCHCKRWTGQNTELERIMLRQHFFG